MNAKFVKDILHHTEKKTYKFELTLCFIVSSTKDVWQKFKFLNEKGSSIKNLYERCVYESVDDGSLS